MSDAGGPKSSAAQRSVLDELIVLPLGGVSSGFEPGEPAQRAEARCEAVLAAAGDDERGQVLKSAAYRPLWGREAPRGVMRTDERVGLVRCADEDAVVEPLCLDELELPFEVCAGEDEDDPA